MLVCLKTRLPADASRWLHARFEQISVSKGDVARLLQSMLDVQRMLCKSGSYEIELLVVVRYGKRRSRSERK